jgi:hypothetical protein
MPRRPTTDCAVLHLKGAKPVDVKLTYFKQSGKYYSEGTLQVTTDKAWDIYGIVRNLLKERCLPELVDGHSNFIVHVDIPDGVPAVIVEQETQRARGPEGTV